MVPDNRRPDKAIITKELKRLGIEFSPLEHGSALYAKLLAAKPAEEEPAEEPAKPLRRRRK